MSKKTRLIICDATTGQNGLNKTYRGLKEAQSMFFVKLKLVNMVEKTKMCQKKTRLMFCDAIKTGKNG